MLSNRMFFWDQSPWIAMAEIANITVQETQGISRTDDPVICPFPIPQSSNITDSTVLSVFNGSTRFDTQVEVISRWGGASTDTTKPIQYCFLYFLGTVVASTTTTYIVKNGSVNASGNMATDSLAEVSVNTGVVTVIINKTGTFNIVDSTSLSGSDVLATTTDDGPRMTVGGVVYTPNITSATIERNGPITCTIRLRGNWKNSGGTF